jgi:hypothetical protein
MLTIQRQVSLTAPTDIAYTPSSLVDEPLVARPRASNASTSGVVRFLGSAAQNSRLPTALKSGTWSVRWSHQVSPQVAPAAILESRDHVLVQAGDWLLLRGDGMEVASGQMGRSALTADAAADLFYLINAANHVETRSLQSGELQFRWPLAFGEAFSFPVMSRTGARVFIAGVEGTLFEHPPIPPTMGVVYLFEISGSEVDGTKLLHSVSRSDTLIFKDPQMLAAMVGDRTVVATPGYLATVNGALEIEGVFQAGDVEPMLLSADESAWMYLIVRRGASRSMWVVRPDGRRHVNVPISEQVGEIAGPPAVGYDHRIYLWTKTAVLAFSPGGERLWEQQIPGGVAGVGVSTDDRVIVGAGSEVSALDPAGQRTVLYRFEGETITAPPILAINGDLLVATDQRLYRLSVK